MKPDELSAQAQANAIVFEEALAGYVALKVDGVVCGIRSGEREVFLDATACVWCLFDDERFVRCGDAGRCARERAGTDFRLNLYWSMGDVVMPEGADEGWVATRIADEARRQVRALGLRARIVTREVEGTSHTGVVVRRPLLSVLGHN